VSDYFDEPADDTIDDYGELAAEDEYEYGTPDVETPTWEEAVAAAPAEESPTDQAEDADQGDGAQVIPGSEVAPAPSLEERIALAARGTRPAPPAPTTPDTPTLSQKALLEIATHDPARYAELREQGHKLDPQRWGPDR
jgi:hypothetical protein